MKGFRAVFVKELRLYFSTPIAYALMAVFWALTGYYFSFNIFLVNVAQMVNAFHNMSLLLMLIVPLLTMRVFAEENRTGKLAAGLVMILLMLAGTATALVPLTLFGQPDVGPIIGGYIGVFLLGAVFVAVGTLISSLCSNQLVAALLTWAVLLLLWYVDYVSTLVSSFALTRVVMHLSLSAHYVDLIRGVLPLPALAYFAAIMLVCTAFCVQVLRMRRA